MYDVTRTCFHKLSKYDFNLFKRKLVTIVRYLCSLGNFTVVFMNFTISCRRIYLCYFYSMALENTYLAILLLWLCLQSVTLCLWQLHCSQSIGFFGLGAGLWDKIPLPTAVFTYQVRTYFPCISTIVYLVL